MTEKLAAQKNLKKVEADRNRKRRELYDAQDAIDHQRDELIAKIEKQLNGKHRLESLFTFVGNAVAVPTTGNNRAGIDMTDKNMTDVRMEVYL